MLITVLRVGAIRHGVGDGTGRARVPDPTRPLGHVPLVPASRAGDGTTGDVALVVERVLIAC